MRRFSSVLNLTKSLTILLIFSAYCSAQDENSTPQESSDTAVNQELPLLAASDIASNLYSDPSCKHIAFTCGNHQTMAPLHQLNSFLLETASKDIKFRYVLVELPADLEPGFIAASKGEMEYDAFIAGLDEPWPTMIPKRPQSGYYSILIKTIQTINAGRPKHPILLIPVDGFTTTRVAFEMTRLREGKIDQDKRPPFVDSVNRERDTAKNVLRVVKEIPDARGAIFYHQGHILKGLRRELPELENES